MKVTSMLTILTLPLGSERVASLQHCLLYWQNSVNSQAFVVLWVYEINLAFEIIGDVGTVLYSVKMLRA